MKSTTISAGEIWNRGDYQRISGDHLIVSERLCSDLKIGPLQRVLDVACGTGNTALAAARRQAEVVGCDIADSLLNRARRRAEAEELSNVQFDLGDAGALPYPAESFDVVLSTFGAVFLPDQAAAAREMLRVLRPGGWLGMTSYTAESVPGDVYRLGASIEAPPEGASLPAFAWSSGERLIQLLGASVLGMQIDLSSHDTCFVSAEALVDRFENWYGPVAMRMTRLNSELRQRYRQGMMAIFNAHNRATDGSLCVSYGYAQIRAIKKHADR